MAELTLAEMMGDVEQFRYKVGLTSCGPARQTGKLIEEVSELLEALLTDKPEDARDGVTDCLYVIVGIAVAMGMTSIELEGWWRRVQASNMTKTGDGGLSPRGVSYQPPSEF